MRRLFLALALTLGALACAPPARACPMCQVANESGTGDNCAVREARPRAYMYSILFMLTMPAMLLTGYGFSFYRLHRRQRLDETGLSDTDLV